MRFQARRWSCGAAAVANALEVFGVYQTEEEIAKIAKTNPDGTSAAGIVRALRHFGFSPNKYQFRDGGVAVNHLLTSITLGLPNIICVDRWAHWMVVGGKMGSNFVIIDSASLHLVEFLPFQEVQDRWKHTGNRYSGIVVQKDLVVRDSFGNDPEPPATARVELLSDGALGNFTEGQDNEQV